MKPYMAKRLPHADVRNDPSQRIEAMLRSWNPLRMSRSDKYTATFRLILRNFPAPTYYIRAQANPEPPRRRGSKQ